MSDNSTNRYIVITYVSDNGLSIRQKININRELAKASNEFTVYLLVSANSDADTPLMGEIVASKKVIVKSQIVKNPAIKIKGMSNRIISKFDLQKEQKIIFDYVAASNTKVYVELQQKIGTGYQRVTDKLNRVDDNVKHNMGIFAINPSDGVNDIMFKLSNSTSVGTYRLLFTIKDIDDNVIFEVPYTFIVSDIKK